MDFDLFNNKEKMGCSCFESQYEKSYKYILIDSDIKKIKNEDQIFLYLLSTKSLSNFIKIIEQSKILEHKNSSTNEPIDKYEKKLKRLFEEYILEEGIKTYDNYDLCNDIAKKKNNINEFIIVTLDFLELIKLQKQYLKYVLIKLDESKNKNYIYFSKYDKRLYFNCKRKGIYEFITNDNTMHYIPFQNSENNNIINNKSKYSLDNEKINVHQNKNKKKSNIQYEPTEFRNNIDNKINNNNDSVIINNKFIQESSSKKYVDNDGEKSNPSDYINYNIFNNNKTIKMNNNSNIKTSKNIYNSNNM